MCRLINPSKNELGKVSEQLVEKMDSDIIEKLQFNQWRNTDAVLKGFNDITDKSNCNFFQFDVKEYYPSMTEAFYTKHSNLQNIIQALTRTTYAL